MDTGIECHVNATNLSQQQQNNYMSVENTDVFENKVNITTLKTINNNFENKVNITKKKPWQSPVLSPPKEPIQVNYY